MESERSASEMTPHWQELRDGEPEVHEFLEALAEAIYVRGEDRILLSGLDDTGCDAAETEGLVGRSEADGDQGGERVAFTDEGIRHDYLARHSALLLREPWNEGSEAFAGAFGRVARQITQIAGSGLDTRATLLRILAEGQDAKMVRIIRKLAERATTENEEEGGQHAFWDLYGPFCNALPHLDVQAEEIVQSASPIIEAASGDLMGGRIDSAVGKMARQSKARAIALYEASVSRTESAAVSLAANALVGLSDFDFNGAHGRALRLTEEDRPALRRVGMAALGRMPYGDEHIPQLRRTWTRLEQLRENPNEKTDYVLVQTYGDLLGVAERLDGAKAAGITDPDDIGGALVELAGRSTANTRHSTVQALFSKAGDYTDSDWYEEVLFKVTDTPSAHGETIRTIDYCVNRYFEGDSPSPERALEFLRVFVQRRPDRGEVRELLGMTLRSLQENFFEELQAEMTRWLLSSEPKLHRAAADLYHSYDGADRGATQRRPRLNQSVLDQISEQEVVWIVLRACGYIAGGGELLASLALSALRRDSVSDDLAGFVEDILSEYVLYNYPEGGREALERISEEEEVPEVAKRTAREAMERSEQYYERLRELPQLKEFDPPSSRVYQLRRAQQQHQSGMMERARNQSDFMKLFAQLPLKCGKAFFLRAGARRVH